MKRGFLLLAAIVIPAMILHAQIAPTPSPEGNKSFTGYCNITDLGLLIGSQGNAHAAPFSFNTINAWHLTPQLSVGLGTGVEFIAGSYMPFFADLRYYVRNTGFSPFFMLDVGYSLPLDDDQSNVTHYYNTKPWNSPDYYLNYKAGGGWLFNPGFGIRNMFSPNFGVVFSVGYRNQRLFYKADEDHRLLADYNRLVLKIGILFR